MFIDDQDPLQVMCNGAGMLHARWPMPIHAAVISGSGFSSATDVGTILDSVPYSLIDGLPISTVVGHGSQVVLLDTVYGHVLVFTGRAHAYEGHRPSVCASHAALAINLGCKNIIMTNACGGLDPALETGAIVLPTDVINRSGRMIAPGKSTSIDIIDEDWVRTSTEQCWANGSLVRNGTYIQVLGPSYETRAEIRMMRQTGSHTIGMSSAVEAAWAASHGARICIVSLVTNTLSDTIIQSVCHSHVVHAAHEAQEKIPPVLRAVLAAAAVSSPSVNNAI